MHLLIKKMCYIEYNLKNYLNKLAYKMKLKFNCTPSGIEISFLLTDTTFPHNPEHKGSINDDAEFFSIDTFGDVEGVKSLSVKSAYANAASQSIANLLLKNYRENLIPQKLADLIKKDEIEKLLDNQNLLELEEKIYKEYPRLLLEIENLENTIAKIKEQDFTLDYSTPKLDELIQRRNKLTNQILSFQNNITKMAKKMPEHPQLIADIISDSNQQIENLKQYTEETLEKDIKQKNVWMEQSINEEIELLRGSLLSVEEVKLQDKIDTLAKLRLIKDLPESVAESQKKFLLTLDKEIVEIKTKQLNDLKKLNLLTKDNQEQILGSKPIVDKSCDARLNTSFTFFTNNAKDQASRESWTLYSNAIEENIARLIEQRIPMEKILTYAASKRGEIARIRNENGKDDFGLSRTGVVNQDGYSNDDSILKSVIANKAFVSLSDALTAQKKLDNNPKELHLTSPITLGDGKKIYLPAVKLTLTYDSKNLLAAVETEFQSVESAATPRAEALQAWQDYYLYNKDLSPEELLEGVGKLAFMLSRYYSFERGTGSTTQWIVRGIVQQAFGIDLKDITLGAPQDKPQNGAPLDVYSHVCDDADFYAKQFCKKVGTVQYSEDYLKKLNQATSLSESTKEFKNRLKESANIEVENTHLDQQYQQ